MTRETLQSLLESNDTKLELIFKCILVMHPMILPHTLIHLDKKSEWVRHLLYIKILHLFK